MKRILILDHDAQFASQLFATLGAAGDFSVSSTPMMREACLVIAQQPHDLVFVPYLNYASVVRSLRSLQPDLRVVVTVDAAGAADAVEGTAAAEMLAEPETAALAVQRFVPKTQLLAEPLLVLDLLQKPAAAPAPGRDQAQAVDAPRPAALDVAALTALLQRATRHEQLLSIVLSHGEVSLAHSGTLSEQQASEIAGWVMQSRPGPAPEAQIQFARLPGRVSELLLYTRPVRVDYWLTLVALPNMPVTPLRQRADRVAKELEGMLGVQVDAPAGAQPAPPQRADAPNQELNAMAIVWRAEKPLPAVLLIPLRRALERIADASACVVNFEDVQPDYVHLVLTCPPGRDSAWVAHRFKRGSEAEIQQQFGVQTRLWRVGYFASPSSQPFTPQELALFLEGQAGNAA